MFSDIIIIQFNKVIETIILKITTGYENMKILNLGLVDTSAWKQDTYRLTPLVTGRRTTK